jgi:hypothetical protein
MVRSAAAVLAVLIIPSFALAQEPQGTHTVVKDDTLWDLAQRYYSNPFEWRVIWEANRGVVEDPNWIYPAEVLVIPGLPADETPVEGPMDPPVEEPVPPEEIDGVPVDLIPFGMRPARPTDQTRTVFFNDTSATRSSTQAARATTYVPVSADQVYSAPWMIGLMESPASAGSIAGFANPTSSMASSVRSYDKIRISMPTPARIGANLQLYRIDHTVEDVGQVVVPTGVATVSTIGDGHVVAVVTKEFNRIQVGDLVRPLPTYTPRSGVYAEEVSGGSEAMVMAFAGEHTLTDIGHIAFLDLGSDDGVVIGDEFVLYGDAVPTARRGRLQVVGVTQTMAAARVVSMVDDVFRQGVVVRLAKKMR